MNKRFQIAYEIVYNTNIFIQKLKWRVDGYVYQKIRKNS